MDLLLLALDIQEAVLHLPVVMRGEDPVKMRELQVVVRATGLGRAAAAVAGDGPRGTMAG